MRSAASASAPGFLEVIAPGPQSLLQDSGRRGQWHLGITSAGPMDRLSFDWANRLAGNPPGLTALEVTFGGLRMVAHHSVQLVVTGPQAPITVNQRPASQWQLLALKPGDRIDIGYTREGCRLYVAVPGGFHATSAFGSSSTVVREGLGGLDGRPLLSGDRLKVANEHRHRSFFLPLELRPVYAPGDGAALRVIPCLQARILGRSWRRKFFAARYRVASESDRMGIRLEGEPLDHGIARLLSEAVTPGAIQITPDGQPIIMMRDHQTIGGYPKLGTLLSLDCDRLAQYPSGAEVCFIPITPGRALALLRQTKRRFETASPIALAW
ncbi:MAG: allophanate hydrolase [Porticoccaceae bacterium]|nr:allophanate hydrolase [Porticoccaceae bacterium]